MPVERKHVTRRITAQNQVLLPKRFKKVFYRPFPPFRYSLVCGGICFQKESVPGLIASRLLQKISLRLKRRILFFVIPSRATFQWALLLGAYVFNTCFSKHTRAAAASRGSRKCELIRESVVLVFFRKLALIEF